MRIAPGDIVDFIVREGESLVLTKDQCLRLNAIPTAILVYLDEPRSLRDVERHLGGLFGPAPDGRLQDIMRNLVRQGVLREMPDA